MLPIWNFSASPTGVSPTKLYRLGLVGSEVRRPSLNGIEREEDLLMGTAFCRYAAKLIWLVYDQPEAVYMISTGNQVAGISSESNEDAV